MGRLLLSFLKRVPEWERPAQIAAGIALALMLFMAMLVVIGPEDLRVPALAGLLGVLLALQAISLWANRDLVTPYTKAQRAYLQGDFPAALAVLEAERVAGRADVRDLTLLGNAYRQTGDLTTSAVVLQEALTLVPDHAFAQYGWGRTLLASGRYLEAAEQIEKALAGGAPSVIRVDLGEAHLRAGNREAAQQHLSQTDTTSSEAWQQLMRAFLLYQMDAGDPPETALIEAGLPYWRASADRFAASAYGAALRADVRALENLRRNP